MKKLLLTAFILSTTITAKAQCYDPHADDPHFDLKEDECLQDKKSNIRPGINIVPKINLPIKNIQNINRYEDDLDELFNIERDALKEIPKYDNASPFDTHLRSASSKIKLSFNFKGVPVTSKENVIGFAAGGSYSQEKGWDGIIEFFKWPNIGICSYDVTAIESIVIDKNKIEYLVNNKPSDRQISGSRGLGYLYSLSWYTDKTMYTLLCANKSFDKEIMTRMIALANKIDAN